MKTYFRVCFTRTRAAALQKRVYRQLSYQFGQLRPYNANVADFTTKLGECALKGPFTQERDRIAL